MRQIHILFCLLLLLACDANRHAEFVLAGESESTTLYVDPDTDELIKWAVNDLAEDMETMTGRSVSVEYVDRLGEGVNGIVIGKLDDKLVQTSEKLVNELKGEWESFVIEKHNDNLFVVGSDIRGTVYAIFEIAERIGLSPWKWWADVTPLKREVVSLELPVGGIRESPSVQYRGIFLNDEDWGLQPWAASTFEPDVKDIGPKTYEKIFQLLLRLKANTLWPAMHPSTQAFFSIPGNKEMAAKYHIVIGTSHAEPMLRNNVDEWDEEERGEYNYFTNSPSVKAYWQERIADLQNGEYFFTVGMRGIHDSGMEGDASQEERVQQLETIIRDQRQILDENFDVPVEQIPQVFIPYKEVLELYDQGMNVPDDITLMWTDDNYGYIRRLSNETEQQRSGGSGVYYHLSYWGRPHDYLWLSTTQPGLIWYEMMRAYENGAKKIWIANVGDIKPAEYTTEFFLDLAWDVGSITETSIKEHLVQWSTREFGESHAKEIADAIEEYYRLAFLRKPEYMGWSQTEPTTGVRPTTFDADDIQDRIDAYTHLYEKADQLRSAISEERQDAYFQLVEYPIKSAALMNFKFLRAQQSFLLRDPMQKGESATKAQAAYDEIIELTDRYNRKISNGKWMNMMSMKPRNLPVFSMPDYHLLDTVQQNDPPTDATVITLNGNEYQRTDAAANYSWRVVEGLGYSNASVTLFPFDNHLFTDKRPFLEYEFDIKDAGTYEVEVRCLPTHANAFDFEVGVEVNDSDRKTYNISTQGRSETWKENVLRNAALATHTVSIQKGGKQTLRIDANRTGIVVDQVIVRY